MTFYCVKVDAVWFDFASFGLLVLTGGAAVSYIGYDEARFFLFCARSFLKDKMNILS